LFNLGRAVGGGEILFIVVIALLASIYVLDIMVTVFLIQSLKGKALQ
jgi:hypothetical protein